MSRELVEGKVKGVPGPVVFERLREPSRRMKYEFHPEAELELYEAALRYESEVPELGRRFGTKSSEWSISCSSTLRWVRALTRPSRHFVLRKFPFSVVYGVTADLIYIVAIAHGSREPEYWRSRVQDR